MANSKLTGLTEATSLATTDEIYAVVGGNSRRVSVENLLKTDLAALASSIEKTAVDVFVYDTSLDSDGGAWRKRTQGTSWYNETLNTATRGSRKEFPAVAVIVAEAISHTITVYDGDDPDLPMWMVFNEGTANYIYSNGDALTSVNASNGMLVVGTFRLQVINFVSDSGWKSEDNWYYYSVKPISSRNDTNTTAYNNTGPRIVNTNVRDVAMTVLPNAPIDAATGLPVPTIAVATDGGVSVIKDDGTVVDITITQTKKGIGKIHFTPDNRIIFTAQQSGSDASYWRVCIAPIPTADISATYWQSFTVDELTDYAYADYSIIPALSVGSFPSNDIYALAGVGAVGGNNGLSLLAEDPVTPANGMVAYTTSTYNTGYMVGDIKGAWLSDTVAEVVTGAELIVNGDFASDIASWTDVSTGTGSIAWNASGHMDLIAVGLSNRAKVYQGFSTVIGKTYTIKYTLGSTANHDVLLGSSAQGNDIVGDAGGTDGAHSYTFVAISTTTYVTFSEAGTTTATVDNISVKLADADRSVNNKGLIVNGTITKTAVATGAELMKYSGFSASNYLEQPYNSDLDFGTGDFSVMGWVNINSAENFGCLFHKGLLTVTDGIKIETNGGTGDTSIVATCGGSAITSTTELSSGWQLVSFTRISGTVFLRFNDVLENSGANSNNSDIVGAKVRFGIRHTGGQELAGSLALWRISATAPSAAQIAKIYNDEKFLFQENAACTLYGASDAVTALAHDPVTDLLHVGTSQGRSDFAGLRRVNNTTTAVGVSISAVDGLIVED